MPRPIRRKIKLTEQSVNDLFQEIYDENLTIRAKIARLFTKWEQKVKEGGEIAAIGDQIIKLIAAEAKNQDQKISLLKYLKEVVFENNKKAAEETANATVSTDERNSLLQMVQEELEKKKRG